MKIEFTWDEYEVPEYDPEKHNPERVFAMLCYRGIHYAKWVVLDPFKIKSWRIDSVSYTHLTLPTIYSV